MVINGDFLMLHMKIVIHDYSGKGVDQIKYIIDCLKNPKERYSRRMINFVSMESTTIR